MKLYIYTAKKFSEGYPFMYWDWYKDKDDSPIVAQLGRHLTELSLLYNIDFSEYSCRQLYVEQKYSSYKEEILKHLTIKNYDAIMVKLEEFMNSVKIKQLICKNDWDKEHHYTPRKGEPISRNHVISIILYCDFTDYCSKFSGTFRKSSLTETFVSVKARNREFWFQSKHLREVVEIYGSGGYNDNKTARSRGIPFQDDEKYNEEGPYFTGINGIMVVSQFSLFLSAPTSTTKDIEVSLNFTNGKQGMIVQFDRTGYSSASSLTNFDCSFISRYPEENERIFMFGTQPIRIESVRIVETGQNLENVFKALFAVDALFSGVCDYQYDKDDMEMLTMLVLRKEEMLANPKADPYAISMIKSYINRKQNITIDIYYACVAIATNKADHGLISGGIIQSSIKVIKGIHSQNPCFDDSFEFNLIAPNIFKVFSRCKTMIIQTTEPPILQRNADCTPFNMIKFLKIISQATYWNKIEIHGNTENAKQSTWIQSTWQLFEQHIRREYEKSQMSIKFVSDRLDGFDMVNGSIGSNRQYFLHRFIIRRRRAKIGPTLIALSEIQCVYIVFWIVMFSNI